MKTIETLDPSGFIKYDATPLQPVSLLPADIPLVDSMENLAASAFPEMPISETQRKVLALAGLKPPNQEAAAADKIVKTALAPWKELSSAIKNAHVALSIFAIFNRADRKHKKLADDFDMIKSFLSLAHGESALKPGAINDVIVEYEGKRVHSVTTGLLQFTVSTYNAALRRGRELMKAQPFFSSIVPRLTAAYLPGSVSAGWRTPALDKDQFIAVLGQMDILFRNVASKWSWFGPSKGWVFSGDLVPGTNAHKLASKYGSQLKRKLEGMQLLMTFYHVNGLNADFKRKIYHEDRLKSDPAYFNALTRIPDFSSYVGHLVNAALGSMLLEAGDPESASLISMVGDPKAGGDVNSLNLYKLSVRGIISPRDKHKPAPFLYRSMGNGVVVSPFSMSRRHPDTHQLRPHYGTDFRAAVGQSAFAITDGVVSEVRRYSGKSNFGLSIVIASTEYSLAVRYAHLSQTFVKVGDHVRRGELIGRTGRSGASAPHLHLEILPMKGTAVTGKGIDPESTPLASRINHSVNGPSYD